MFERGIGSIIDFYNLNGELYTFDELRELYNVQGTFLDYQSVIRKIPNEWKVMIDKHNQIRVNGPINAHLTIAQV